MKRIFAALAAAVTTITTMFCFCMTASAANYHKGWSGHPEQSTLVDTYGIFSDEQTNELIDAIQSCAEELEMNIIIYVASDYRSDSAIEIFADDTYDEIFGEDTDGVFYYMDLGKSPAYDYISTSGKAVLFYQKHIETIFTGLDRYLPPSSVYDYHSYSNDIADGVKYFLGELEYYSSISKSRPAFSFYKDVSSGKYFYYKHGELIIDKNKPPAVKLMILGSALFIGLIVAIISYFIGKASYKFKASTNANVYVSKEETRKGTWDDHFIRAYTSKVKIESSSGGSRGGGGGGHSHSGGHGGGGHHR